MSLPYSLNDVNGSLEPYGLILVSFKVTPSCVPGRSLDVFWLAEATAASQPFTPRYNLCVSETAAGPWHSVLEEHVESGPILGVAHELLSHRPGRYVRLVAFDPTDKPIFATEPMDPTHQMNRDDYLEYREQLRLEHLALRKWTGIYGFLFKRIITECACDCADEILEGAFDSHCPKCLGTGKVGGYHPPVRMLADWSDTPKALGNQKEDKVGISEVEQRRIKIMPFPQAAYKDLWGDGVSDLMYEVANVDLVVYKVFPTAQRLIISLLPKTDPAYKLSIPTL